MQFQEASFAAAACVRIWKWVFFNLPMSDRVCCPHALQLQNHRNSAHARCWLFLRTRKLLYLSADDTCQPAWAKNTTGKTGKSYDPVRPHHTRRPQHFHTPSFSHHPHQSSSLQTVNKEYTCNRVVLNETEIITHGLTVKNDNNKIKCLKMTKSMPQSASAVTQYFNGKWFKLKLCTVLSQVYNFCTTSMPKIKYNNKG